MLGRCAPVLAPGPLFEHNPTGSPDLLAYPVPKAYRRYRLGTWVTRFLGVAPSNSSPKAAHALGRSLTFGTRVMFGRVTCMAQASLVLELRIVGFLMLCRVCLWVLVLPLPCVSPPGSVPVCWGSCFAVTAPFFAGNGGVRARFRVLAVITPSLAGAYGVCVCARVLPTFRHS